jgi:hypothetical protein
VDVNELESTVTAAIAEVREKAKALSPQLADLRWEIRKDPNGWDYAHVTMIVADQPSGEPYVGDELDPLHDLAWEVFQRRAVPVNPYVYFQLASEQAA